MTHDIRDVSPGNMEEILSGIDLPASKEEIILKAEENEARQHILDELQAMPEGAYDTLSQINKALGLMEDLPGHENQWPSEEDQKLESEVEAVRTRVQGQGQV